MTPEQERRLRMFVDRKKEVRQFCNLLETDDKCALIVWGDSGIGKSALMARLIKECADRDVACTQVVWGKVKNYDTVALMKKIARQLGHDCFPHFRKLVEKLEEAPTFSFRVDGETSVLQNATVEESVLETVAAINIEHFHMPRSSGVGQEQLLALTEEFIADLAHLLAQKPLVVFLDHTERMASETQDWVNEGLLGAFARGELKNIKVCQFGRHKPDYSESDLEWLVEEAELGPLDREDIVEYLEKREVEPAVREALADMVAANTDRSAHQVAKFVESFLEFQRQREDGGGDGQGSDERHPEDAN